MKTIATSALAAGVLAQLACTAHEKHEEPAADQVAELAPDPVEVVPAPAPLPVIELEPEPPKPPLPPAFASLIQTRPGVSEWKELPGLGEVQGFFPFVIGVLAMCGVGGDDWCKLYDDGRLELSEVGDLGNAPVWGEWRSDAWRVEVSVREEDTDDERASIRLYEQLLITRWRGSGFKTQGRLEAEIDPNSYGIVDEPAFLFRKGWAGGMLVHDGRSFTRYPKSDLPPPSVKAPNEMIEFFEAKSGALFSVTLTDGVPVVHPPCPGQVCDDQAFVFPKPDPARPSASWDFPLDVARGGDSLTILLTYNEDEDNDDGRAYLLHYDAPPGPFVEGVASEPGTWTFEALPLEAPTPDVIWPDTRGGLWIEVGDALWYRDVAGAWFDVALPGDPADFTNRLVPREFLVLVEGDETNHVFATRGPVKPAPAPAP